MSGIAKRNSICGSRGCSSANTVLSASTKKAFHVQGTLGVNKGFSLVNPQGWDLDEQLTYDDILAIDNDHAGVWQSVLTLCRSVVLTEDA
jgi:hypothetical protein